MEATLLTDLPCCDGEHVSPLTLRITAAYNYNRGLLYPHHIASWIRRSRSAVVKPMKIIGVEVKRFQGGNDDTTPLSGTQHQ
jgi:hypothetical protein